jgi:hypothetical protein
MWTLAAAGIAAFVLGASAQQIVRAVSQGVVTPADPIWALQEPQNPPTPQEGETPAAENAQAGAAIKVAEEPPVSHGRTTR